MNCDSARFFALQAGLALSHCRLNVNRLVHSMRYRFKTCQWLNEEPGRNRWGACLVVAVRTGLWWAFLSLSEDALTQTHKRTLGRSAKNHLLSIEYAVMKPLINKAGEFHRTKDQKVRLSTAHSKQYSSDPESGFTLCHAICDAHRVGKQPSAIKVQMGSTPGISHSFHTMSKEDPLGQALGDPVLVLFYEDVDGFEEKLLERHVPGFCFLLQSLECFF